MVLKCVLTLGLMAVAPAALAGSVGDKPVIPEVVNKSQSKAPPSEVQRFSLLKSIVTAPFRLSWSSLKFSGSATKATVCFALISCPSFLFRLARSPYFYAPALAGLALYLLDGMNEDLLKNYTDSAKGYHYGSRWVQDGKLKMSAELRAKYAQIVDIIVAEKETNAAEGAGYFQRAQETLRGRKEFLASCVPEIPESVKKLNISVTSNITELSASTADWVAHKLEEISEYLNLPTHLETAKEGMQSAAKTGVKYGAKIVHGANDYVVEPMQRAVNHEKAQKVGAFLKTDVAGRGLRLVDTVLDQGAKAIGSGKN